MANADVGTHFGPELKDSFKPVNAWASHGISWLDEIQQFYRDRSAIEKEYAMKLSSLCKKYADRKAKKIGILSVGDTPAMTPGSLENASLTTWTTQLNTVEQYAADRDRFGTDLLAQVAEPLKQAATQYDEIRKSHAEFHAKLEKERDGSYNDLKRMKGKYDGTCQEVESRRKKADSSLDTKAQAMYKQQIAEMNNTKNTYLICINITNKLKDKFYHEYVPELIDGLQDLNESRVMKLNTIWARAAQLEHTYLTNSTDHVSNLLIEIPRNAPHLDSLMFLRHNVGQQFEPPNVSFEPSAIWHDDDRIITDESAKVFLHNMLSKSKTQVREMRIETDKRRAEIKNARRVKENIRQGKDQRNEADVVRSIFAIQELLHEADRKQLAAEVEISTIVSIVGDLSSGAQGHNFRSQTFKIPTNCDFCGERIWGLSAKGFDCRDCGYTCHSKCEMKVPAGCPGEQSKEDKKRLKAARQEQANPASTAERPNELASAPLTRKDTINSLSSGYAANAGRSISNTASQRSLSELPGSSPGARVETKSGTTAQGRMFVPQPANVARMLSGSDSNSSSNLAPKSIERKGRMLYEYQANGDDEITVYGGSAVVILEPDDGSGWMRVRTGSKEGLVPASYVEAAPALSPAPSSSPTTADRPESVYSSSSASVTGNSQGKRVGPAVAPRRGAKKLQYVEALYDYEARTEMEFNMLEGDRFVLINRDSGDGWVDVERGGTTKSVPASYIQEI